MASSKIPEVFAFLLLIFTQSGLCLRCYECNSAVDQGCDRSPPPQKYLVECLHHQEQESHKFQYTITPEGPQGTTSEAPNASSAQSGPPQDVSSLPQPISSSPDASHQSHEPQPTAETNPNSGDTTTTLAQSPPASTEISQNPSSEQPIAGPTEATSGQPSPEASSTEGANAFPPQRRMRRANVNDSGDSDSFITVYPDIPMEATYCRKVATYIPEQDNGNVTLPEQTRIVRGCGWIPDPDDVKAGTNTTQPGTTPQSCKWLGIDGVQTLKCICKGEGCNSAQPLESLKTQTVLLLGLMASGYMYIL